MDAEEKRFMRLMDEMSSGETEKSESKPYSSDDDIKDPNYTAIDVSTDTSRNESLSERSFVNINDGGNLQTVSDDEWEDITAPIPDFKFDATGTGLHSHFVF